MTEEGDSRKIKGTLATFPHDPPPQLTTIAVKYVHMCKCIPYFKYKFGNIFIGFTNCFL